VRALLAQLAPAPGDLGANARAAAEVVARHPDADLAVFPELFLCGYDLARVRALAVSADGPALAPVRSAAAESATAVLVGLAEDRGAAIANSLVAIGADGAVAGVARKVQLFGDEADVFRAADELAMLELAGHRVGPMICFDVEFPEWARALARAGSEVLVTAASNMAPFHEDHLLASRARALDNRLPHLYVNRVGTEAGLRFVGGSRAVAPDGTVLADAGPDGERLLAVEVALDRGDDERVDYLAHLRYDVALAAARPLAAAPRGGARNAQEESNV
jgi:predicted amidohydrolase